MCLGRVLILPCTCKLEKKFKCLYMFLTTIVTNLAISLANEINVLCNAFFSNSRSEKYIFFGVDIVIKKQIKCGLVLAVVLTPLLLTTINIVTVVKICCRFTSQVDISFDHGCILVIYESTDNAKPHSIC